MTHHASPKFWALYDKLPLFLQKSADESFDLLKANPGHPSLEFKPVALLWSARVKDGYRVLARRRGDDIFWFWIGSHDEYERLIRQRR